MKDDLFIKNGIVIPSEELIFIASRSGGPGGQHVNKASTRITVRWNIRNTSALTIQQKEQVLQKLQTHLTIEGDLIIHSSTLRSQQQNKKVVLTLLAKRLRQALHTPKKRKPTAIPKAIKEARLKAKTRKSTIKKMRSKIIQED